MKFQLIIWGLLKIFSTHTILPNFKSIRNNTMKKMLSYCFNACLLPGYAQQTFYCSKQTGNGN